MPVTTEVAIFDLLPEAHLEDLASSASQHFQAALNIIHQDKGTQHIFWGLKHEDPTKLVVLIDWDDVAACQHFANSELFKTVMAELVSVASFEKGPPSITHTIFTSDALKVRRAPVTGFKAFLLPEDATDDQKSALENSYLELAQFSTSNAGSAGYACGWALDTLPYEAAPSGNAIAFNAIIGLPSKDHHQNLKEIPGFKDVLLPVLGAALPGREQDMFHVSFHEKEA